jgi:tetratricopeptide (TPR) repeat protein
VRETIFVAKAVCRRAGPEVRGAPVTRGVGPRTGSSRRTAMQQWMRQLFAVLVVGVGHAAAAAEPGNVPPPTVPKPSAAPAPLSAPKVYRNAHAAYSAGAFPQAVEGFVAEQVARPDDVDVMLNLGSAYYKAGDYEAAAKQFGNAAFRGGPETKASAYYNLGNTAYQQGKLNDAVSFYEQALKYAPNDSDTKFNLEFVRQEIRRRLEEEKKRQQQQQPQGGQQNQKGDQQKEKQQGAQQSQSQAGDKKRKEQEAGTAGEKKQPTDKGEAAAQADKKGDKNTEMSKAEALRALDGLDDKRPEQRVRGQARRTRPAKDW